MAGHNFVRCESKEFEAGLSVARWEKGNGWNSATCWGVSNVLWSKDLAIGSNV